MSSLVHVFGKKLPCNKYAVIFSKYFIEQTRCGIIGATSHLVYSYRYAGNGFYPSQETSVSGTYGEYSDQYSLTTVHIDVNINEFLYVIQRVAIAHERHVGPKRLVDVVLETYEQLGGTAI